MNILATTKLFYTHAWETYLIGGLLIFFLGLLIGRYLWRHCQEHADRVEAINQTLRERQGILTHKNRQLANLVDELPEDPAA